MCDRGHGLVNTLAVRAASGRGHTEVPVARGSSITYIAITKLVCFQYALGDHEVGLGWTRPPAAPWVWC